MNLLLVRPHLMKESKMTDTVVAVFDEYGQAQSAIDALFNEGFSRSTVKLSPADERTTTRQEALRSRQSNTDQSSGWSIGDFFRSLFGTDQDQHGDDAGLYAEAMRRGSYLLAVEADSAQKAHRAADIMHQFNAVDIHQRASGWRSSGWTGYQSDAPVLTAEEIRRDREGYSRSTVASIPQTTSSGEQPASATLPVIEEQLQVGKRVVQRGGVRIYSHITETPVEEWVQLREEHVTIERTPVNQPASAADIDAFKEGTIEVRESAEEAVVGKTARVVEEVRIGKEVTEHTEKIKDTVRRTDVDVEAMGNKGGKVSDDVFRQHWQSNYAGSGRYEDYAHAYRYGASLAGNKQYQGYRWDELEPRIRSEWEAAHAGSPWDHTRQAVRYGWESTSGN